VETLLAEADLGVRSPTAAAVLVVTAVLLGREAEAVRVVTQAAAVPVVPAQVPAVPVGPVAVAVV